MGKAKRVTSKEVAERAGVSRAVVSYVINNGPRPVSSETRAKVKKAIEEMGYYPNELARSLKAKQTATVGVMIPNLINPVYSKIVESLEEICAAAGYTVMLSSTERDPVKEKKLAEILRSKQVDGVVIIPNKLVVRIDVSAGAEKPSPGGSHSGVRPQPGAGPAFAEKWGIPALPFSTPHLRPETRGAGFHRSPTEPGVRQH